MNTVNIIGRLTRDPEMRYTQNQTPVASFCVAVNRNKEEADFLDCVAWKGTAELLCSYFHKGDSIGVTGSIQTRTWKDKQGNTRKTVEINASRIDFPGSRKEELPPSDVTFEDISGDDNDLPF